MTDYLQLVYSLRQDLNGYTDKEIQILSRYHNLKGNIADLKWMIALRNARSLTQKAQMPPAVKDDTIKGKPVKMIFISGGYDSSKTTVPEIQLVNKLITDHSDFIINNTDHLKDHNDASTAKGHYKAYLLSGKELAAVSSGKYMTDIFASPITTYGFLRESEIKWVQTSNKYRGKGLCAPFVQFILTNLKELGVDNVVVENVGGEAGCRCYVKAATALGMGTINIDSTNPQTVYWEEVDCSKDPAITHLFFDSSEMYQNYLRSKKELPLTEAGHGSPSLDGLF